jgi:hypothetical protein
MFVFPTSAPSFRTFASAIGCTLATTTQLDTRHADHHSNTIRQADDTTAFGVQSGFRKRTSQHSNRANFVTMDRNVIEIAIQAFFSHATDFAVMMRPLGKH